MHKYNGSFSEKGTHAGRYDAPVASNKAVAVRQAGDDVLSLCASDVSDKRCRLRMSWLACTLVSARVERHAGGTRLNLRPHHVLVTVDTDVKKRNAVACSFAGTRTQLPIGWNRLTRCVVDYGPSVQGNATLHERCCESRFARTCCDEARRQSSPLGPRENKIKKQRKRLGSQIRQ